MDFASQNLRATKGRPYNIHLVVTACLFLSVPADGFKFNADVWPAGFSGFVGTEAPDGENTRLVCDDGHRAALPLGDLPVDEPFFQTFGAALVVSSSPL